MKGIDHPTRATTEPLAYSYSAVTPGYFTEGEPGVTPPTTVTPKWFNSVQGEFLTVITSAGLTPSDTDNTQLYQAIRNLICNPKDTKSLITFQNAVTGYNLNADGFEVGLRGTINGYIANRESAAIIVENNGIQTMSFTSGNTVNIGGNTIVAGPKFQVISSGTTTTIIKGFADDGNYVEGIFVADCRRTANNAFSHFVGRSGNSADVEFNLQGNGNGLCDAAWTGGGADYAEYFEADSIMPRGTCVVLEDGLIRAATNEDAVEDIIGVVRDKNGGSAVIGNAAWNKWDKKYLKDEFDAYVLDADGNRQLNPSFDPAQTYMPRIERSEWHLIGLVGQVAILKGQPVHPSWKLMNTSGATTNKYYIR